MKCTLYAAAVIAISAAAFLPGQAMAQVEVGVVIGNPPPAPRFESVPQPRLGYVWAPGYWSWDGQRHAWSAGHWEPERSGYQYQRAEWVRDNGGWRLNPGGWVAFQVPPSSYDGVRFAPPRPRHEWTPRARPGYIWAAGHWEWRGQRHQWVPGAWIAERPGYDYVAASWTERNGRWYLEPSRWAQRGGREHGYDGHSGPREHERGDHAGPRDQDRDRDGVPNRYDRDRDGDGVPNRFDSRPDNPRRD